VLEVEKVEQRIGKGREKERRMQGSNRGKQQAGQDGKERGSSFFSFCLGLGI
jgi:hypothetical protein